MYATPFMHLSKAYRSFPAVHFRTRLQLEAGHEASEGAEVWLLLTRHLRNHRTHQEYIALTAHDDSGAADATPAGSDVLSTKVRICSAFGLHVLDSELL